MEAEIKVEPSGRTGIVPVGSYLIDSLNRMGFAVEAECGRTGNCDSCAVEIRQGKELLSSLTAAENEQLSEARRRDGARLSCQVKIEKEGELIVMAKEKQETEEEREAREQRERRKEFEELPLEKKVARLLELEAVTLTETVGFVINSPFKIFEKVMDVMAEFGFKLDQNAKNAKKPAEHQTTQSSADSDESPTKKKKNKEKGE